MSLLEVDRLAKAFAGRPIFTDVSLRVEAGEAVAIVGPSGSGKTTLLRCLDGLDRADSGTVVVGAHRLDAGARADHFQTAARALRRSVGFVFQGCHLFSHRTVLENVMEGPVYVRREPPEAARERRLPEEAAGGSRWKLQTRRLHGPSARRLPNRSLLL